MGVTSLPRIIAQLLAARGAVSLDPWTSLFIGSIEGSGAAVSGQLYEDLQNKTIDELITLFGEGDLTNRLLRARDIIQGRSPISAIALTDAGTQATFDIVVAGTATEDGTITLKVIDAYSYTVTVDVTSGDAAADVAAAIKAAIDALPDYFPASAGAVAVATVPLTAKDGGTVPNKYTVECTNIPAGLTINTDSETSRGQFSGGATDPTLTTVFDNVQSTRFHSISWPYQSDFTVVKSFLAGRNVINNQFLHGMAFIGYDDTESNITTTLNGATPENSPNLVFMGNRVVSTVAQIITPPDWRCAEFMAIEAMRQTENVPISDFVMVTSARDISGGPGLASLAYYGTPLARTSITNPNLLFDGTEQSNLKDDGFTIVGVNESSTSMFMGEVVSTYKKNSRGEDDNSFKFLNYIRTGFLALEVFFKLLKADYKQFRLTEGDVVAGRAMANKETIEAKYASIYKLLSGADYVLTQAGAAAERYFFQQLNISLDLQDGNVTSFGQLPIVTQIRQINMTFQMSFSVGG